MQNAEHWSDELAALVNIIEKAPLEKTRKWGADMYTYQGKNVVSYGGFKQFFSLWFYNGVFLSDPLSVLINASEGKTKSLRQWRFTSKAEINEKAILTYIMEAIEVEKQGLRIKPEKSTAPPLPRLLKDALEQDSILQNSFNNLTPGKQKEYIIYLNEPKQEITKQTRLTKIIPLILQGSGLNDKYKK